MRLTTPITVLCVLLTLNSVVGAQETSDLRQEMALDHYDAGRYAEARELLESLDADGVIGGPDLYRLSYCRRITGDQQGEQEARERALTRLQIENVEPSDLEIPFYLANALRNAGRPGEANTVARIAVERFEAGGFTKPRNGIDWFRLAKLYQDQNLAATAAKYYRQAIEAFATDDRPYPANVLWARRFLGDLAFAAGDYPSALSEFALITASERPVIQDLDRYAKTAIHLERYQDASSAWQRAQKLNPADGDAANYRWRLAAQAAQLSTVAKEDENGNPWEKLSKEDLESQMTARVEEAKAILQAVASNERTDKEAAGAELRSLQSRFLGAALNYAIRQFPIRETAFFGGYAPFIFHPDRWQLTETNSKGMRKPQRSRPKEDS